MANKLIQSIVPVLTGGSTAVNVEGNCDTVHIKPASGITLTSALNITVTGTPIKNTEITFIYGGNITTDTATGKSVNIFGTELTDAQALYEGEIKAYYNGSAWEVKIFPDAESGLSNLDGSGLVAGSIATAAIADDAVTNDKLNSMTRGTVKVGGTSNVPTDLDGKTSGQILIGDGTDINSVAVTGDITIDSAGVTTIGAGKVTTEMLANTPTEYYVATVTLTSAEVLDLYNTPIEVIAAPGTGKSIIVISALVSMPYNSATYAAGGDLGLVYSSAPTVPIATAPSGVVTASVTSNVEFANTTTVLTTRASNSLSIMNSTAVFTTGDSPLILRIIYAILD